MAENKDARQVFLVNVDRKTYNREMHPSGTIKRLLEAANSSTEGDSSEHVTKRIFLDEGESTIFLAATSLYVIGLNEKQDTKFTDSLIESARNAAIANLGYYTGLQKAVWKEFCTNFLKSDAEMEG